MPDSKTTGDRYAMRPIDVELYETCAKGTLAQVKALLDKGADPNAVHWEVFEYGNGNRSGDDYYCIHEAARNPDVRVFDLLVEHGADPCQKDFWGAEPLSYAAKKNHLEMVKHLVSLGNDPNLCDMDGYSVVANAALNPDVRVVEFLLDHGAELDNGATDASELGHALRDGTPQRVRFFIERGSSFSNGLDIFIPNAPLENLRVLLNADFDPNSPADGPREIRQVDLLTGRRRALFLQRGAVPFFSSDKLFSTRYDRLLFGSKCDVARLAMSFAPYLGAGKGPVGRRILKGSISGGLLDSVHVLVKEKKIGKLAVANCIHLLLVETRQACRKDFCRVTPFFKPKKGFLWHASLDYGEARVPLDFVVANAFQGDAFDRYSKGGVFQMRFMGLGESLECMNRKGVVRMWGGKIVARERREKGDPSIDHVDVVFSEAHMLNPCEDKANPAFAEFTSTIENVATGTICGQPCYRIRLWSGPLEDPASFPWTLLIAKSRIAKGWIPRVGDFVNGIAAMYGTFDDKAEKGAEPTVYQPEFLSGDSIPEPLIPKKDIPKPPKGKPETEWLPRRPKDYPDAPAPRVPLPAFTDEPFKKFVTYPEYRQHIGKDLVPAPPPSRKRLREIVDEIDFKYTYMDDERWAFGRVFNVIGVRHAVLDRISGETHLWLCIPLIDIHYDSHAELMISIGNTGHVVRYTIHSNEGNWAHGELWCEVNRDGNRDYTIHASPDAALSDIPNIKKKGFVILCAECTGNMFQAICTNEGVRKRYYAEWLLFGKSWCRGKENLSEKRLLEICRLFLSGGITAIQNEECWQKDQ